MEIKLEITGEAGVNRLLRNLGPAGQRALVRAVNKTATSARKIARKEIRRDVALQPSYIQGKLALIRARKGHPEATIQARRTPVLLTRYGARNVFAGRKSEGLSRRIKGVSVKVAAKGRRKIVKGGFFLRLRRGTVSGAGALGIARRIGKRRYPIEVLFGPSVDQVFEDVREEIAPQVRDRLQTVMRQELQFELAKAHG